jgi:hypothetical protein
MNLTTALTLGRVSNLPTVWTNIIAGVVLAGGTLNGASAVIIFIALSLFYIGGMFLNDAFDALIDAQERSERPIPAGAVSRNTVFACGYAMLAIAIILLLAVGTLFTGGTGTWPAVAGINLAGLIILYNWHHKQNALSPLIMGLCRVLVYVTAGVCVVFPLGAAIWIGAALLVAYLIGLTYVAKQENIGTVRNMWPLLFLAAPLFYLGVRITVDTASDIAPFWLALFVWILIALYFIKRRGPGDIPKAVVSLIAGISLLDAALIAGAGEFTLALVAVAGFFLTLVLQKFIAGT